MLYKTVHKLFSRNTRLILQDCAEGLPQPLYGFVSKVMLVTDQRCELNVTCDIDGNKIDERENFELITKHIRNENLIKDPLGIGKPFFSPVWKHNQRRYDGINFDRQTREEFSASGPPSCRTRRC